MYFFLDKKVPKLLTVIMYFKGVRECAAFQERKELLSLQYFYLSSLISFFDFNTFFLWLWLGTTITSILEGWTSTSGNGPIDETDLWNQDWSYFLCLDTKKVTKKNQGRNDLSTFRPQPWLSCNATVASTVCLDERT